MSEYKKDLVVSCSVAAPGAGLGGDERLQVALEAVAIQVAGPREGRAALAAHKRLLSRVLQQVHLFKQ